MLQLIDQGIQERDICELFNQRLIEWKNQYNRLMNCNTVYVDPSIYTLKIQKIKRIIGAFQKNEVKYKFMPHFADAVNTMQDIMDIIKNSEERLTQHNDLYVNTIIDSGNKVIDKVDGLVLDDFQLFSVLKSPNTHFVFGSAGSGKTLTVVAKSKQLLSSNEYGDSDLLVLTSSEKAAQDVHRRIWEESANDVDAMTVGRFVKTIITSTDGSMPNVTDISLTTFVKNAIISLSENSEYARVLNNYCMEMIRLANQSNECLLGSGYRNYIQSNPLTTLKDEQVSSKEEVAVANFLYYNNINYEYNVEYKYKSEDTFSCHYSPSFHILDTNIYIDCFEMNSDGSVPAYANAKNIPPQDKTYSEFIEYKKSLHLKNGTALIDLYSFQNDNGEMIDTLRNRLNELAVMSEKVEDYNFWRAFVRHEKNLLYSLTSFVESAIIQLKMNKISPDKLLTHINGNSAPVNKMMVDIIEPIYTQYTQALLDNQQIDYIDLVTQAIYYIKTKAYDMRYVYLLVDDFQNLMPNERHLISSIQKHFKCKLFCTCDDWQAAYGPLGLTPEDLIALKTFWPYCDTTVLENSYRLSNDMEQITEHFIMTNNEQMQKNIIHHGDNKDDILRDKIKKKSIAEITSNTQDKAITSMIDVMKTLPHNSKILLIGRCPLDIFLLSKKDGIKCTKDPSANTAVVELSGRNDLSILFCTIQDSIGLESDYSFIINNTRSISGFPNYIESLQINKRRSESFRLASERRLFYIALTRASQMTYLVTVNGNKSLFVYQLYSEFKDKFEPSDPICPYCGGKLRIKSGRYGGFYGCENYSNKEIKCKYTKRISESK